MYEFEVYYNTAWEMGFITADECEEKINEIFDIMAELESEREVFGSVTTGIDFDDISL